MTRVDEILERAESLYRDIDLSAVKAWKEKKPGRPEDVLTLDCALSP